MFAPYSLCQQVGLDQLPQSDGEHIQGDSIPGLECLAIVELNRTKQ